MLRWLPPVLALALLAPATNAASPELEGIVATRDVQRLVDGLLAIPEVRSAFREGDGLYVDVSGGSGSQGDWSGKMQGGKIVMERGSRLAGTHGVHIDARAMLAYVHAYDPENTAKLLVKGKFLTAISQRQAVNLAIAAVQRTPLDAKLGSYEPKAGDTITFQDCTGTLEAGQRGYFIVTLCDERFVVNELGGVSGRLPRAHLTTPPAGIVLPENAGWSYGALEDDGCDGRGLMNSGGLGISLRAGTLQLCLMTRGGAP